MYNIKSFFLENCENNQCSAERKYTQSGNKYLHDSIINECHLYFLRNMSFGATFCLKSTDSITSSSIQKVGEATATLKTSRYIEQMLLTAHDTVMSSWYRLECITNVACVSAIFEFVAFPVPNKTKTEDCVPDNMRVTLLLLLYREVAMNEKLIVQMDGKRTRIFNTKVDNLICTLSSSIPSSFLSKYQHVFFILFILFSNIYVQHFFK